MELKGHSASVLSLSFNGDSQRCVCVCACVCVHTHVCTKLSALDCLPLGWLQHQRMGHGSSGIQTVSTHHWTIYQYHLLLHCVHCVCTVRYKLQEDPKLLLTGQLPESGSTSVALAPDSKVVTVAINSSLFFFSTSSGEMMEKLTDVHGGE